MLEKFFLRVDVTEEWPSLVPSCRLTLIAQNFSKRRRMKLNLPGFSAEASAYQSDKSYVSRRANPQYTSLPIQMALGGGRGGGGLGPIFGYCCCINWPITTSVARMAGFTWGDILPRVTCTSCPDVGQENPCECSCENGKPCCTCSMPSGTLGVCET